jgi:hypothetical protein
MLRYLPKAIISWEDEQLEQKNDIISSCWGGFINGEPNSK